MEQALPLIISLISGIVGGNVAGAAMPDKSLGAVGNSVSGAVGGGIGGFILQALGVLGTALPQVMGQVNNAAATAPGMDIGSLLANVGGSGVGGAILTAVVALIKNSMNKSS